MGYNAFEDGGFLYAVTQIFAKLKGLFDGKADTILGTHYGVCSTAAATAAKTVTIDGITELTEGLKIIVNFTNGQGYNGAPTLNVNGLGAKNIKRQGTTNAARYEWSAGELIELVYDGTYWVLLDGALATTSYYGATKLTTSATSTNTATALTPASLNSLVLNMIAGYPIYSASATYEVGDRVRYGYQVWECITAITTAEAWTAEHWHEIDTIMELLDEKYVKPSGGIPKTDLASDVQTSLGKADTALQTAPVADVQVNGTSVVQGGVANVPLATPTVPGVITAGTITVSGSTPTINALPGVRYVCGEVATLDITLPASSVVDVVFESGSTATVLNVTPPSGVTLKWANGFDPTALDTNTTYEINIMDGLGVAAQWT